MHIGLDGFPLISARTGVGHYTFELARALALASPDDQFELISPFPFHKTIGDDIDSARAKNLRLVNPTINAITKRWWSIGLPLYVKHAALDLFHGTNYEVPLWNKRRSIVTIHDLSVVSHPQTHKHGIGRRARRRLPIMIRSAARIITPSETVKREIVERFATKADKIVVIPEAARTVFQPMHFDDTAKIRGRFGLPDDFILCVGTIEPRKNLFTLVHAFSQLIRNTSLQTQLVIAGGQGWLMDNFNRLIRDLRIDRHVHLVGYLDDYDLRALYSSCKVFVYPSLYEGFGLPPLEAMACGAPVIASRIPTHMETLEDAVLFVDPTDATDLATALADLLQNETKRRRLSSEGVSQAAKFSWERTARLTLDLYRQVVQEI